MIRKQPSFDSTWTKPPTGQHSRSSTGSSARQTLLPYRPTQSPRPTSRPTPPGQLPTIPQMGPGHDHLSHLPSHSKATFKWIRGELLGQGSYGRVFMALNASTGQLIAVKQVELTREDHKPAHQDALRFLAFESETLKELDHPNIVQYLGCETSDAAFSVFLEYVPGGTIATLLHKYGRFREEVTKSFAKQILEGLQYLHHNGIIHRDLKPDNILVEPTGVCKISDFGISKRVDDIHSPRAHTLMKGTVQYMAPETLGSKEKGYDGKIDIWSVGCMVMEMWTGEKPWGAGEYFLAIMLKLRETMSPPPLPTQLQKELSSDAHNFRDSCFHINPVQRPSAFELKQHPYLRLPQTWTFNEVEIPHPSRERKVNVSGRKQREYQDDETTYRPKRYAVGSDATIRPQDNLNAATSETIRQPIPRGPSPPIVVIKPLKPASSPAPSPSPTEAQEQDNATSESSATSNSRRSGKRKGPYIVVNPGGEEPTTSYRYLPPPLPPTSQPYSSHLGTSSKYSLGYIPEPPSASASRLRSSSTPQIAFTPDSSSSSSAYPTYSQPSSKSSTSSTSSLFQPSGTEGGATWKRPPATAPPHRARASPPLPNSQYERRYEQEPRGPSNAHHSAAQLRTPPPPTMPPPLPPTDTPPLTSASRPDPPPSATPPRDGSGRPITPHRRGNRPNAHDIVRRLGDYFPDHDLDQPVVAASSVDDLTESSVNNKGNNHDNADDDFFSSPSTLQHVISRSPGRFSRLRPHTFNPSSFHRGQSTIISPPDIAADTDLNVTPLQSNATLYASAASNDGDGGVGRAKSIRWIAEEQERKRQSNPGKARRRTFWDFKMEELKKLPQLSSSSQRPASASDNDC